MIYLWRHAKASWNSTSLEDHERPLNRDGKSATLKMASRFSKTWDIPDVILCSTAKRTRQTLQALKPYLDQETKIIYDERLYLASTITIHYALVQAYTTYNTQSLMVIGHNPGLVALGQQWASLTPSTPYHENISQRFPTGAMAVFSTELNEDTTELIPVHFNGYMTPKILT